MGTFRLAGGGEGDRLTLFSEELEYDLRLRRLGGGVLDLLRVVRRRFDDPLLRESSDSEPDDEEDEDVRSDEEDDREDDEDESESESPPPFAALASANACC